MAYTSHLKAPVGASVGNPLFELSATLASRRAELRRRRALRQLLDHETYVLDDMGLQRVDIDWVLTLPLNEDARAELQRLTDLRRKSHL
jgi:uncharacterized protein YjiS (DUF1127 family)